MSGVYQGSLSLSSQGVGGSVHLPRGYLKSAFETIRAKGGVCIVDEVSFPAIIAQTHCVQWFVCKHSVM